MLQKIEILSKTFGEKSALQLSKTIEMFHK